MSGRDRKPTRESLQKLYPPRPSSSRTKRNAHQLPASSTARTTEMLASNSSSSQPQVNALSSSREQLDKLRLRNRKRFAESPQSQQSTLSLSLSPTLIDALVNKSTADNLTAKQTIGVGRATGISRVPDAQLSNSAVLVQEHVNYLKGQVDVLVKSGQTTLRNGNNLASNSLRAEAQEKWEFILGKYRQLTMSVTASAQSQVKSLAISVYEGAADASLYAGNLSFYLSCQTRLLKDLYMDLTAEKRHTSRYSEFIAYSLLYFGVFHRDSLELVQILRSLDRQTAKVPSVKFALSIVTELRNRNALKVISMYSHCEEPQQVLIFPSLESIQGDALSSLIRSYMELSKQKTISLLALMNESEFLTLLRKERPDLAASNVQVSEDYRFRVPVCK